MQKRTLSFAIGVSREVVQTLVIIIKPFHIVQLLHKTNLSVLELQEDLELQLNAFDGICLTCIPYLKSQSCSYWTFPLKPESVPSLLSLLVLQPNTIFFIEFELRTKEMAYFLKRERVKEMRLSWYAKSFTIPEVN